MNETVTYSPHQSIVRVGTAFRSDDIPRELVQRAAQVLLERPFDNGCHSLICAYRPDDTAFSELFDLVVWKAKELWIWTSKKNYLVFQLYPEGSWWIPFHDDDESTYGDDWAACFKFLWPTVLRLRSSNWSRVKLFTREGWFYRLSPLLLWRISLPNPVIWEHGINLEFRSLKGKFDQQSLIQESFRGEPIGNWESLSVMVRNDVS